MHWSIKTGNDNTHRDKIDICNLPLLYTTAQTSKKKDEWEKNIDTNPISWENSKERINHRPHPSPMLHSALQKCRALLRSHLNDKVLHLQSTEHRAIVNCQLSKPQRKRMNRREIKTLNTSQEHIAEKLQHWYIELAKREIQRDKNMFWEFTEIPGDARESFS